MQILKAILPIGAMALALAACSAKVTSDGGGVSAPTAKPFVNAVAGPALDGQWKSGCVLNHWDTGYIKYDMTVKGQAITRKESQFADAQCTQPGNELTRTGLYRFVKQNASNVYEVEYKFNIPNGSYTTGENVLLQGSILFITDRVTGDGVIPDIPLSLAR